MFKELESIQTKINGMESEIQNLNTKLKKKEAIIIKRLENSGWHRFDGALLAPHINQPDNMPEQDMFGFLENLRHGIDYYSIIYNI